VLAIAKLSITLQDIPLEKQRNYCDTYVIRAPGAAEEKNITCDRGKLYWKDIKLLCAPGGGALYSL